MISGMNPEQTVALRDLDPVELGRRIKTARLAKGLTQTALAGGHVSVGMLSRIEAGQRRVRPRVLEGFAERLGMPVSQLILGITPNEPEELRLELDYAELALESGQAEEAENRSVRVLERAGDLPTFDALRDRARYVHALSLEAVGKVDDAIFELESLGEELPDGVLQVSAGIALSRCYRESGDFARAIESAERLLRRLEGTPLAATDEAVQLTSALAGAHILRGDIGQAARAIKRAMAKAEKLGSPAAQGAAYWNASIIEAERGRTSDAVALAEKALGLLREGQGSRNLARLRIELGILLLQLDPPDIQAARGYLDSASEEFAWASTSPVDSARADVALAKAHLLAGETSAAQELAERVCAGPSDAFPLVAAEARRVLGQARLHLGDRGGASAAYQDAAALLTGVGVDRGAAQLWFELADLLDDIGEPDAARRAYRSAAAATGLQSSARPQLGVTV